MTKIVKNKGGRPEIKYPYLWELYHFQWEKGDITEKNMMDWLGLKRTTLYKLSKKYKEEVYKNIKKIVVSDEEITNEELVWEYILENKEIKIDKYNYIVNIFYINHNKMRNKLKISSTTIIKILKKIESKGEIHKIKRGIWRIR